ncbi:NAD(P)-dependent oxidoreductase [Acidovorax sp. NCPPB 3859]|nr:MULTISPECIES: NAD(P)-dependent oxidoreductase [unclassified Acidovorax]MDA8449038.1 NAD(P)-dependent oxidoreductase [Acidovorax sp. GBBC 3297]MDA8458874.1 NAD(P)-dependent oxidoreductase [Acidovorax sp. GBBC 3333]MDA8463794.1 NAD(P)-dependent oxidoreductase [Acidovorax sp. GBBC 3332]MDA8468826.1 NAD(P)-dependent oxidoreductase [Acidovorax sp. GBBC 3299]WCM80437.1 NAD(P)-dependent oxidoreductase [Acidovorax sp. GBBC 712]
MQQQPIVGFIGVGVMGEPICRHIATKGGAPVIASDLNQEPLARLAEHGVRAVAMDELTAQADIVFMSLPSGEVMKQVVAGPNGLAERLRAGTTLVDLSTSSVDVTLEVARLLEDKGIAFADAPVMRTRAAAEAGTLAVPVGASPEVFGRIESFIRTFASDVTHAGDISAGQVVKILNNMVLYETVLALSEAAAIGRRAGVQPDVLFQAFSTGSADSFALRNHGMKAIAPQQFPEKAFPVTYAKKDISYAVALGEQVGVDPTGARNLLATLQKAIDAGHGEKYAPAISLVFEQGTPAA